ncbi:hypothetical protein GRX01_18290 [Halobaculum sp. WSA2]|uniref:DOD-type homing endonuclease domain-containing protein n=1 Tax=Halobaculum saliterrae TaxID=2073113 RepID=A0A6B0SWK0_9EURY|nr:LAGLIDADG family homing endonuclease [Halobaculum saliterrae]MXR43274.1 hypothetical protein [Halobaculum saliterrae]
MDISTERGVTPTEEGRSGGLAAGTNVLGADGSSPVEQLVRGDRIYAMEPLSRTVKLKRVVDVDRIEPAAAVDIDAQRARLRLAPGQYVPFVTDDIDLVRYQRANRLNERHRYRFISEWDPLGSPRTEVVDLTDHATEYEIVAEYNGSHGHSFRAALPAGCEPKRRHKQVGYAFDPATFDVYREAIDAESTALGIRTGAKERPRPYRFAGDDFIQLLGWFVTEGSIYTGSDRNSASVKIAQETPRYRDTIRRLLDRLGIAYREDDRSFRIGSNCYGQIFSRLCGSDSRSKRLPSLVWDCSSAQKRLLLETLLAGDGNEKRTYYTVSNRLAGQVLRLCVETGVTPAYHSRDDWRVYCRHVPSGFNTSTHCSWVDATQPYYRIVLEDYPLFLAGRNGTFQWLTAAAIA